MRSGVLAAVALLSCVWAGTGHAADETKGMRAEELGSRPIEISADKLVADSMRNAVAFEGGVVAVQGDVTLHCDRLNAEYSKAAGAIEKIVAEGNVKVLQVGKEAKAARADFFNMEQRIVLSGGAELRQGENVIRGETVTIFLRESRSTVSGGAGKRVTAVINPKGGVQEVVPGKKSQ